MSIIVKIKEMFWAWMCLRGCNSIGQRPRVQGKLFVRNGGRMEIGDKLFVRACHVPVELASLPGGSLTIGDNCFINSGASIAAAKQVSIGDNCLIGNYTLVMDTDFHDIDCRDRPGQAAPVIIEDDVWLAAHVTILKGVHIGRGAVVAAGSVVVANVAPLTLVGGVPAKFIKSLARSPLPTGSDDSAASELTASSNDGASKS